MATLSIPAPRERGIFTRLYGLILPYRRTVAAGMFCLLLSVAAELYPPLVWQQVVDVGLANRDWWYIGQKLVLLVAVFGLGQVCSAIRGVLLERAGQRLTLDLRLRLYDKLQTQSAAYFAQRRTGDLLARLTADVDSIQDVLIRGTDSVVANGLRVLGVAAIFIALQPVLGLIVLIPMLLVGMLLKRYNRRVRPIYRAARQRLGDLTARLSDNLNGIRVIQSFAQEQREMLGLERTGRELYDQQVQAVTMRNRVFPLVRWVANFGNVLMLGGGVLFIMRGEFTLGGLLAYRGYGRYFYGPIDDLVNINDLLQQASAAGRRIFEVLDAEATVTDARDAQPLPAPLTGDIRFEHVYFGYDPARPVLHDISLHIRPGERVALLGPSGVGKSTLLALVARLYDPNAGRILIDGRDLRWATLHSLRSQTAQVQQETFLFNTSALENVRYGRPDATRAEVEAAARAANAHGFLSALPQGYDTLVGERGIRLSGGQKQRLAVARALLANTPLLLLDEPTSAVEPESEASIIEALERLMHGRTTLIVSHRLSLAQSADRVVVVADGRIAEEGPPAELLARPGSHFAQMVRADSAFTLAPAPALAAEAA
ncbi:MAG: ABC transporter ATP-binding protein [Chloroflexi bacterium SZAS-1]|nr:ABC transporter ATP-binding protein [Chloroflexi bacterium SZAS-1]